MCNGDAMKYKLSDFRKKEFNNDTELFRFAIDEISKIKGCVELILDKEEYHFDKEYAYKKEIHLSNTDTMKFPVKEISILLEKTENLTIIGSPTKLVFNGDHMAIALIDSKNIKFRNISIEYTVPTVSEMTLIELGDDTKSAKFKISDGQNYEIKDKDIYWYSQKDSKGNFYWTEKNAHRNYGINVTYPNKEMARAYFSHQSPFENVLEIRELSKNIIEIHYKDYPIEFEEKMIFQFNSNTERRTCGIFIENSSDVKFEEVNIRFMPGFGLLGQMSENLSFINCQFKTDKNSEFVTSSQADGIHVSGAKGKILIDNCIFDNTHDDPINIHGTYTKLETIYSRSLELKYMHHQQAGFVQYHKGDKIRFIYQDTLLPVFEDIEFTVVSNKIPVDNDLQKMKIEVEEDVPNLDINRGIVVENVSYNPEVTIKDSVFTNVFTRCILVSSSKTILIENNKFIKPTLAAIYISNDANDWYESGAVKDITIINNYFVIDSIGRTQWKHAPAIYFDPIIKKGEHSIHENILIEKNIFELYDDKALIAHNVGNLIFRENEVGNFKKNERCLAIVNGEDIL